VSERKACWFASLPGAGPCDGRLRQCHLVPRQLLKRELGPALGKRAAADPRSWVWGCGGPEGNAGHHGAYDVGYPCRDESFRVPRHLLPACVEEFAAEHDLEWWVDRTYGPRGRHWTLPTTVERKDA
jgi:hypothetical protein